MTRTVQVGESDPVKLRVYFDVRLLDGTRAIGEAGGQPQVAINGSPFDATGISVLSAVGYGRYTAQLLQSAIMVPGDILLTRYGTPSTLESRGDDFQVIDSAFTLANRSTTVMEYYGTLDLANQFYSLRIPPKSWSKATPDYRIRSLRMATRAIDRLNYSGNKVDPAQLLQFPRGNTTVVTETQTIVTADSAVPQEILEATFLCAPHFLEGWNADLEISNLMSQSNKIGPSSTSYDRSFILPYLRAGIPSAEAWELLLGFLRDPREIAITRES